MKDLMREEHRLNSKIRDINEIHQIIPIEAVGLAINSFYPGNSNINQFRRHGNPSLSGHGFHSKTLYSRQRQKKSHLHRPPPAKVNPSDYTPGGRIASKGPHYRQELGDWFTVITKGVTLTGQFPDTSIAESLGHQGNEVSFRRSWSPFWEHHLPLRTKESSSRVPRRRC